MAREKIRASFVEPMLLLRAATLPEGPEWLYELKFDGYRALGIISREAVSLRSRNDNDFNARYPAIAAGLKSLPADTVIDGEIVALDDEGRPSFNLLQNSASSGVAIAYFIFDVLVFSGQNVMDKPLSERRALLENKIFPKLVEPIRYSPVLQGSLAALVQSVTAQKLEGLVAKRHDSRYEPGARSGAWRKMRINQGQAFVIGGYTFGGNSFDALVFGYYEGTDLIYTARTRNGFTPKLREELLRRFKPLETANCPFVNLPEKSGGRWGAGLTASKMEDCRWLQPILVGQFEFVEWTPDNHLRHSKFIALREDKAAKDVRREDGSAGG